MKAEAASTMIATRNEKNWKKSQSEWRTPENEFKLLFFGSMDEIV